MASLASTLTSSSFCPNKIFLNSTSSSFSPSTISINRRHNNARAHFKGRFCIKALSLDFSGSFFEGGMGEEDEPSDGSSIGLAEEKEEPQCPPGLRQYETMVVLRPDMSEDERLTLTQKYEELIIAGGGMYVEIFNRGVIPLAYDIKKRNKAGETNTYLDGIYLLFTYFTKPESMRLLEIRLQTDDNVIRSSSFKIRKRKY
ncbi:hypothetical protein AQUCO_01300065v1 [Aquilegia coerulea]|uniref:30S ribosomal protein S6 alpha, chloroplastic n=1 Tax=Aquilegia coerulea TaxID=218851 RepID=A0A2G5DZN8_AQUCA|nr:hypothetical protein AQUCO_01300065v1 [Aquilegia coerulea]PIA48921.1 hypothetical protein AQUCO_01300065v1 [Aquilegia coerulea]